MGIFLPGPFVVLLFVLMPSVLLLTLSRLHHGTRPAENGTARGTARGTRQDEEEDRAAKTLQTLLDDFSNPEIAESLEKTFRQLGGHVEGEQLLEESLRAAKAAEKEEAVRGSAASHGVGCGGGR